LASRIVDASLFVPRALGLALFPQLASQGLTVENRRTLVRGATFIVVLGPAWIRADNTRAYTAP